MSDPSPALLPHGAKEILADLAKGQHPYATILSCSDSRVPQSVPPHATLVANFQVRRRQFRRLSEVPGRVPRPWPRRMCQFGTLTN